MANRRMFSKDIVRSDAFLDMPISAGYLYFQLGMDTDDRGYVSNAKSVMKIIGATIGDLEILVNKRFVLVRGDTLILIKGFPINNTIQPSRLVETKYLEDFEKLYLDDNGSYTEKVTNKPCQQLVDKLSTQCSVVESSAVEGSLKQVNGKEVNTTPLSSSSSTNPCNEWDGLDSHGIVDKLVKDKYIPDDEEYRTGYLTAIQKHIGDKEFYQKFPFVITTAFGERVKEMGNSVCFGVFKGALEGNFSIPDKEDGSL